MKNKFYTIELLRFFSSISVILYHYKIGFAWDKGFVNAEKLTNTLPFYENISLLYNYGFYGVQMFFLISGFVFAHIYINRNELVGAKEFFINRFARLYPLHLFTLLLIFLYCLVDQEFIESQFNVERSRFIDVYHFFLNIFFIQSWGFEKGLSFNAPTWSVSVEIGVYITFFLCLKFLRKYKIYFSLSIICLLFILYKIQILNFKYNEFALLFYIGIAIYQIPIRTYSKTFFIISVILVIISFYGRNFKILLFCPGILIFSILLDSYIRNIKIKNLFSILGGTTYSLYLLHYPVMIVALWLETKHKLFNNFYENDNFILFYFLFLIIISICSYRFMEAPLNRKIRNKFL
jgi:peptidoglycan/LPS O-acetylase OafA/YrhL